MTTKKSNYELKKEKRIAGYKKKAEKLLQESSVALEQSNYMASRMQGEPIKIGHHSEKRHRKDVDKMHGLMDKFVDLKQKAKHYEHKAVAAENNQAISSDDPAAIKKLRKQLAANEALRDKMKRINADYRKAKGDIDKMTTIDETEKKAFKIKMSRMESYMKDQPYQGYEITNMTQSIKRLKDRIELLEKQANDETQEIKFDGGSIVDSIEYNRLQIFFDSKPGSEMRTQLKSNGFRWAPSMGAWQRHRSNMAMYQAKKIVGIKGE
jgi:hypothetical protein